MITSIDSRKKTIELIAKIPSTSIINQKMNTTTLFGEKVPGYDIPVLNEREIRAAAGLMFLATFISLMLILFEGNFVPIKYVVTVFLLDFCIRLFVDTRFAPILVIGRFIVSAQQPEYVGAAQKKFAWYIGLSLSALMFVLMPILNTYSMVTGFTCLICLILMFFETAFGICIGCKLYKIIYKEKAQYCPGEICDVKAKTTIQKISATQWAVVLIFISLIILIGLFFNNSFHEKPTDLFDLI